MTIMNRHASQHVVLIGYLPAVALVTVAVVWATMKLTMAGGGDYLRSFAEVYGKFLSVSVLWLLLEQGVISGIVGWITGVFAGMLNLVT